MLTATQANREGAKAQTVKMTHVAESFGKIQVADLVISINATEEEKLRGETRLYFTASRNQEGDMTVKVKTNMKKMALVEDVIGIE